MQGSILSRLPIVTCCKLSWCGVGAGIALIGAMVKGGDKLVTSYFLLSFFVRVTAIVLLIFDRRKACPFCHNVLKPSLKVCPHCDHRLVYPYL